MVSGACPCSALLAHHQNWEIFAAIFVARRPPLVSPGAVFPYSFSVHHVAAAGIGSCVLPLSLSVNDNAHAYYSSMSKFFVHCSALCASQGSEAGKKFCDAKFLTCFTTL